MKYTKEQRIDIGRQVFNHEIGGFSMEQKSLASPNAKRWGLIILNIVFFFGVFQPLFEVTNEVSAWNLRRYLANGISRMDQAKAALISILITVFLLVLIADPIVHLLKLLGVFGEAKRNSRSLGMMLSLLELIALIVVPSTVVLASIMAGRDYSVGSFISQLSIWTYVWLALTIFAFVLSSRLEPTEPLVRSATTNYANNFFCVACGRRNRPGASFCDGCGKPLGNSQRVLPSWFCPRCGKKNPGTYEVCDSCGTKRPKEY